jgi:hypothetical protein
MENRRAVVESAFQSAQGLTHAPALEREWDAVRNACYEAGDAYLAATGTDGGPSEGDLNSSEHMTSLHRAQQLLDSATQALDEFYERHRASLDSAAARAAMVRTEADAALAAAQDVRRRLAATHEKLLGYPSVEQARDRLEASCQELRLARERGDLAVVSGCTERLIAAIDALTKALESAPQREEQARRTVVSVRTRLDALRNRADSIAPNLSALLREFHANSSADLIDNERTSRIHINRADTLLKQAGSAHSERRPEAALDLAAQSRSQLTDAERLIDAVADRLAMLRNLRSDPASKERDVRFRLRDAQRLAVYRGAEKEWGSALDAQVQRIDRIVAGLTGRHPDYWAYHRALEEVSQFISTIVTRIRQRSVR